MPQLDLVAPDVLRRQQELRNEFLTASPFRHVVIDPFFDAGFADRLEQAFPAFDEQLATNEDGYAGGKCVHEDVASLGGPFQTLDRLVECHGFRNLISTITDIPNLIYDPAYYGGGTHDNRHGQDLDPHVDFNFHPFSGQHRRLNLIVFLNRDWEESWGGCLELHQDPRTEDGYRDARKVVPAFNRCVIFETTESSWHGFKAIDLPEGRRDLSRRSFALYYYTEDRPAAETGKPHSTIYVDRPLPDSIRPGKTLRESDIQLLKMLMSRRDHHLQRLYGYLADAEHRLREIRRGRPPTEIPNTDDPELLRDCLYDLDSEVARLRQRLDEIEQSNSWRLTAPLRKLRRLFRS
ncbi:MAG: 2OG-Fe(II) oxygenase [Xanthomonadales bacterium]|nr:2OG-Fe(II) oxygenase [Xanthomonadales bacterium]